METPSRFFAYDSECIYFPECKTDEMLFTPALTIVSYFELKLDTNELITTFRLFPNLSARWDECIFKCNTWEEMKQYFVKHEKVLKKLAVKRALKKK